MDIEAVSCDEMFVDISDLLQETNSDVSKWAYYIRNLIRQRTGCPCSTGFGSNRLLARMATKTAKPNGKFHLLPENVDEYMLNIKVGDLPGVGFANSMKLESLGVKTCGELQEYSINKLRSEFGSKMGETLYNSCRGSDERPLVYEHLRKSVSAEVNYGIRFKTDADVDGFLRRIVKEVYLRLLDAGMKGKNFTLKYMVSKLLITIVIKLCRVLYRGAIYCRGTRTKLRACSNQTFTKNCIFNYIEFKVYNQLNK